MSTQTISQPLQGIDIPESSVVQSLCHDSSGFALFSEGELGRAHVFAHRMLDQGRIAQGRRLLGRWLDGRTGAGHHWVHVQWHMALFELEHGEWEAARVRFQRYVLPAAIATEDALTDAPALLWRLQLAAHGAASLPWTPVAATARRRMWRPCKPYVQLHNLLALAGAGDVAALGWWLRRGPHGASRVEVLLQRMGLALQAFTTGAYDRAAHLFAEAVPQVTEIGGSRAQNRLFEQLHQAAIDYALTGARAA